MEKKKIIFIVISIIFIIYSIICIIFDGSYIQYGRNAGWKSRREYPISFWLSLISTLIVPIYLGIYIIKDTKKFKEKQDNN